MFLKSGNAATISVNLQLRKDNLFLWASSQIKFFCEILFVIYSPTNLGGASTFEVEGREEGKKN
ncbi:hypothetical protein COU57_02050 [Candidatus Pacearchaeota archaeon CG10_big_fil_rev_8_21_14_0_10_32_14]|nr:MAG: hypothetical protein COU57_02050 [Candidatus Pacearchaeota archaeon CG10_big_fil_rev_8_21_14_0_10_32_14]